MDDPYDLVLCLFALAFAAVLLVAGELYLATLLFAVGGNFVLSLLHISLPAFRVAGGVLLFLQALTLTFRAPVFRQSMKANGATRKSPATSRFFRSLSR